MQLTKRGILREYDQNGELPSPELLIQALAQEPGSVPPALFGSLIQESNRREAEQILRHLLVMIAQIPTEQEAVRFSQRTQRHARRLIVLTRQLGEELTVDDKVWLSQFFVVSRRT